MLVGFTLLLCIVPLSGTCKVLLPHSSPSSLSNVAALLAVNGPLNWVPTAVHDIKVVLSSGIVQGEDFFLWMSPYRLPFQSHTTLYLQLYPGKQWAPALQDGHTQALFLQTFECQNTTSINPSYHISPILIATIMSNTVRCPSISFPGLSAKLQQFVNKVLKDCQDPLIVKSELLHKNDFSSHELLLLKPALLIVDGTGQTLEAAAARVDAFLGAHAVLAIAWEPTNTEVTSHLCLSACPRCC